MTEQDGHDEDEMAERAMERAVLFRRLDKRTEAILGELSGLRETLRDRPTEVEVSVARRRSVFILAVAIVVTMQMTNLYTEWCSPGSQAEDGISYVAGTGVDDFDRQEMRDLLSKSRPTWCEAISPATAHSTWPSGHNLFGVAVYVLSAFLGVVWYRWPLRTRERQRGRRREAEPESWDGVERRHSGEGDRREG